MNLFDSSRTLLIGVVHLLPLPGTPRFSTDLAAIERAAIEDALAWQRGGADGIIMENFGDAPFHKYAVQPHTVAMITRATLAVRERCDLPLGINVLRNDAMSALGIAAATGAAFIRVNVHTGSMFTDQGLIEGRADQTLRYRQTLGSNVAIWADVLVKHGTPPGKISMAEAVDDAVQRGLADAVIVTGAATGASASPENVREASGASHGRPVLVGSGVSAGSVSRFMPDASGFIVGTWAKRDGLVSNPVDPERVRQLRASIDTSASNPDR